MGLNHRFETEYNEWLAKHIRESRGERLRRLKHHHGFGEKLLLQQAWWPVVGNLDFLRPEYELIDAEGNHYFLDLAYVHSPKPTCLEADGFGSHARDADRFSFSRSLDRQNEIALSSWNILRFSIDKLKENPFSCQQHIRRMLELWYTEEQSDFLALPLYEREIIRLAVRSLTPITVGMVCDCLEMGRTFANKQIDSLVEKEWLEPASGKQRVRSYKLVRNRVVQGQPPVR